jgi:hypothetical protein
MMSSAHSCVVKCVSPWSVHINASGTVFIVDDTGLHDQTNPAAIIDNATDHRVLHSHSSHKAR